MRIDSLHIISYGKFKDVRLSFCEGFNILYGENEAGKSTVMAFIKAMLYGFTGRGADSDRKRYMPWDGGVLCGELTFTAKDGRQIVIYRKSGKTLAQDTCQFFDAVTGEPCTVDLEAEIGIGENGFYKTVYIGQLAAGITGGDDELTDKFINLATSGDAEAGYYKAVEILKNAARGYMHQRGSGGRINQLKQEIMALEEELSAKLAENQKLISYIARREVLEKEILEILYQQSEQDTSRKAAEIRHALFDIQNAAQRVEEALIAVEKADTLLSAEKEKLSAFAAFDRPIANMVYEEIESLSGIEDRLKACLKKEKSRWLSIGILGLGIGCLLLYPWLAFPVRLVVASLPFLGMCGLWGIQRRNGAKKMELYKAKEKILAAQKQKEEELAHFGCKDLAEYTEKLAEKTALCEKIESFLQIVTEAKDRLQKEQTVLSQKKAMAEAKYGTIEKMEMADPEKAERAAETLQSQLDEKRREAATIDGILSANLAEERVADVIRTEKYALEEELKTAELALDAIQAAQEALVAAFTELSHNFTPKINALASSYLSILTGKRETILMDQKYQIVLDREGHKELKYFSGGTIDQAYLAVRVAMANLVLEENNTPLFLDDIFFQYDATRMQNALAFLQSQSANRQIILFSCREIETATTAHRIKL